MAANFVADIGGTNIRLAQVVDGQVAEIRKYLCADFATVNDAIKPVSYTHLTLPTIYSV